MNLTSMPEHLRAAKRVVIKLGSSLIQRDGGLAHDWMAGVARDIRSLKDAGKDVLVVSSGAVALGRPLLKLGTGVLELSEKQAAAAAGQPYLMQAWQNALHGVQLECAQVLITLEDSEIRKRYLNARTTLQQLLAHHIIPIINENDTVATSELRYGDNDRLAARLAVMIEADCLLILSDVDGLYDANPRTNPNANHIATVTRITPQIEGYAKGAASNLSQGGMVTKLIAANIATAAGCHSAILSGVGERPIAALSEGAKASWFISALTPKQARKSFIAASLHVKGSITIDVGAETALASGKSLLPAGVTAASGAFDRGDTVDIIAADGTKIARGLIAYNAAETHLLMGKRSSDIAAILGYAGKETLIHRDDLVMLHA